MRTEEVAGKQMEKSLDKGKFPPLVFYTKDTDCFPLQWEFLFETTPRSEEKLWLDDQSSTENIILKQTKPVNTLQNSNLQALPLKKK